VSASRTRATALKLFIPIEEVNPAASAESAPTLTNAFRIIQPRIDLELLENEATVTSKGLSGVQRTPGSRQNLHELCQKNSMARWFLASRVQTGQMQQERAPENILKLLGLAGSKSSLKDI
jgi:hypothetical protein